MKVPDVLFIKHCPSLNPERKRFLEGYLPDRVPIKDVRWLEDYNFDHPFVEWVNQRYSLPYGTKLTSNFVKTLFMFQTMIDENIESVVAMDDDALFHKDWVTMFENFNTDPSIMFINMGINYGMPKKVTIGQPFISGNNGGCEVCWYSIGFAKKFLNDLNMNHTIDIVYHGFLTSLGHPIICLPVCTQTSGLLQASSLDHGTRNEMDWIKYVRSYSTLEKTSFWEMRAEYKDYTSLKKKKEDKILELFGAKLDIKNVKWVTGQTDDYRYDILK